MSDARRPAGRHPATVRALLAAPRTSASSRSAATTTGAATRSRSGASCSPELADLHGDKAVWKLLEQRADEVVEVAGRRARSPSTSTRARTTRPFWPLREAARRDGAGRATAEDDDPAAVPDVESLSAAPRRGRLPGRRRPGHGDVPRRCACRSRCCSRARPASARPRPPRRWPRRSTRPLIRLQCYEGIDAAEALYEWNYPRQLLQHPARRGGRDAELARGRSCSAGSSWSRRPLLRAIEHPGPRPAVLLVDEIDRADDDFEAFLFELLAESSVTIPELGTIRADAPAGRRPHLEPHPRPARRAQAPLPVPLDRLPEPGARGRDRAPPRARHRASRWRPQAAEAVAAAARARRRRSRPGIAEAIDWVSALELLGVDRLDASAAERTLGSVLKYRDDQEQIAERGLDWLVGTDA